MEVAASPSSPGPRRGRRRRRSVAAAAASGRPTETSSPAAAAPPAELSAELTRKTMSPCAREHLLDGRAARLGTIPLCGALGSLRFLASRSHDRTGRRGRRRRARHARAVCVDVSARPRPPCPQRRASASSIPIRDA